jgi:hypothetical protein
MSAPQSTSPLVFVAIPVFGLVVYLIVYYACAYQASKRFSTTLEHALKEKKAEVGLDLIRNLRKTRFDRIVLTMIPADLIARIESVTQERTPE